MIARSSVCPEFPLKWSEATTSIGTNPLGGTSFPLYGLPTKCDFFLFSRDHYYTLDNAWFELIDQGYAMCLVDDGTGTGVIKSAPRSLQDWHPCALVLDYLEAMRKGLYRLFPCLAREIIDSLLSSTTSQGHHRGMQRIFDPFLIHVLVCHTL